MGSFFCLLCSFFSSLLDHLWALQSAWLTTSLPWVEKEQEELDVFGLFSEISSVSCHHEPAEEIPF